MKPGLSHVLMGAVVLASGAALWLLGWAVGHAGPLGAMGWWALGSGLALALLARPGARTFRDALLPAVPTVVTLGVIGYSFDHGLTTAALILGLSLAFAPALSGFIRMTMPSVWHVAGVGIGGLALVAMGSIEGADLRLLVIALAATGAVATVLLSDRVLHNHPIVRFQSALLLVAGSVLVGAELSANGVALPAGPAVPALVSSVLVVGVTLPLARLRLAQRLGAPLARRHLGWCVPGAAVVEIVSNGMPSASEFVAVLLITVGAFSASVTASSVTETEVFRAGP